MEETIEKIVDIFEKVKMKYIIMDTFVKNGMK